MAGSDKQYKVQLTEVSGKERITRQYLVNESQYVLLMMALGEPVAYTTER